MEEVTMKHSKLYGLAYKWLLLVFLVLKIANQFVELVSKVVNYNARPIRKLHALISA